MMTAPDDNSLLSKFGSWLNRILLFIFGLPFAGFGGFALFGAWKHLQEKKPDVIYLAMFGAVFLAVGLGMMGLAVTAGRRKKAAAIRWQQQTEGGEKPWLIRSDWAAGRIKSSSLAQAKIFVVMGLAFLGMGSLLCIGILPKELPKGNYAALLVFIFPVIGLGFLLALLRGVLARRRFGECFFEMAAVPGVLGGTLEGLIQTGARLQLEHGLHLSLSCERRTVSGAGDNRNTTNEILWQDEKVFETHAILPEPEPGHSGIPVFFKIPADLPASQPGSRQSILWWLRAKAKMAGPDFAAAFEVPVFKVAGAALAQGEESDPTASLQAPATELRRDEHSKIRVTEGPDGREFYFPAARNPGAAAMLTVFVLIWSGIIWFMTTRKAPMMFPIIFGIFDLLMVIACLSMWIKSSRVMIDSTGVILVNRWLFFPRCRRFEAGDIIQIKLKTGMTSGTKAFHDIKLVTRAHADRFQARKARSQSAGGQFAPGPPGVTLASNIASASEAKWLVQEMNRALGRNPSAGQL